MVNNPVEHAILPWLPLEFKAGGPLINATSLGISRNNPTRNIFYWWSLNGEVSSSLIISHGGTRQWNLYWKIPHVRNTLHLVRRSTAMKIYSLLWIMAMGGRPGLTHRLSTSQWLCVECLWCSHLLVASSCQLLWDSSPFQKPWNTTGFSCNCHQWAREVLLGWVCTGHSLTPCFPNLMAHKFLFKWGLDTHTHKHINLNPLYSLSIFLLCFV